MSEPSWVDATLRALERDDAVVARVLLAAVRGSTPREAGAWMLVGDEVLLGTIGGGRLEWEAQSLARTALEDVAAPEASYREFVLGPELGQCCGGRATLWIDRFTRRDLPVLRALQRDLGTVGGARLETVLRERKVQRRVLGPQGPRIATELRSQDDALCLAEELRSTARPLLLFGAGHVGQAIARIAQELPSIELRWFDPRASINGRPAASVGYAAVSEPVALAAAAPVGSQVLVMTHDHALDYELCRAVLRDSGADWLGLIASESKAARFRSRFLREGLAAAAARRLHAPIGLPTIKGKAPTVIAVSVLAQLLALDGAARRRPAVPCGIADCADCGGHDVRRRPA